jgi:hypothetical protein
MKPAGATRGGSDPPEHPAPPVSVRRSFIEQRAAALGRTWAESWREDLHREGRPAAGGWPGTLREARTRVGGTLAAEMLHRKMPVITEDERELAARTAYASARSAWRSLLDPELP